MTQEEKRSTDDFNGLNAVDGRLRWLRANLDDFKEPHFVLLDDGFRIQGLGVAIEVYPGGWFLEDTTGG